MVQPLVIHEIDVIGPVGDQLLAEIAGAGAGQNGPHLDAQLIGQLASLSAELQRDVV